MSLFDGKLDAVDFMAIEYEERQKKIDTIIKYVKNTNAATVDITNICIELDFKPTGEELEYISSKIKKVA